ncbi:hypothetical protein BC940DRAFT_290034 [Gongronella butleri]|nr:hypothetical protein BC940DRAFT_290034 [Gongronella butleri]
MIIVHLLVLAGSMPGLTSLFFFCQDFWSRYRANGCNGVLSTFPQLHTHTHRRTEMTRVQTGAAQTKKKESQMRKIIMQAIVTSEEDDEGGQSRSNWEGGGSAKVTPCGARLQFLFFVFLARNLCSWRIIWGVQKVAPDLNRRPHATPLPFCLPVRRKKGGRRQVQTKKKKDRATHTVPHSPPLFFVCLAPRQRTITCFKSCVMAHHQQS